MIITTIAEARGDSGHSRILIAGLGALLLAVASGGTARAASCPAGQLASNVAHPRMTEPKGVTDTVIGSIDLAREPVAIPGRQFRLRRLEVAPGGVVPWHGHGNRPAIIHVVSGEITEYSSDCKVPITHRAGDTVPEHHTASHWWTNRGSVPAVLLSADLLPAGEDPGMM